MRQVSSVVSMLLLCTQISAGGTKPDLNDFVWGTATAAYQVEGSRDVAGRQPSIWDAFDTPSVKGVSIRATKPNGKPNIHGGENASHCDEDYTSFEKSAKLTNQYGFKAARMSIAWPRVMTYKAGTGTSGRAYPAWERNQEGIDHYKKVLAVYASEGVSVALTMFHWDLPLPLEDHAAASANSSAWLQPWISDAFEEYAQLLVKEFSGPEYGVKWWITINEPLTIVANGYAASAPHAPGRCSNRATCWYGNDQVEPYVVIKNLVLGHAKAFRAWRKGGSPGLGCGITLNGDWREPFTTSTADLAAATRSLEWQVPLFADPIHKGDWAASLKKAVGARLAAATNDTWAWSTEEKALVHGSHDGNFFMNTYTSMFAQHGPDQGCGWACDAAAEASGYNFTSQEAIGTPSSNGWLFNFGEGMGKLISWYHARYSDVKFIVTENGWGNATSTEAEDVLDYERCNYYRDYIGNMSVASAAGAKVDAYFAWSLMDNYEWADGFSTRFGLTYVDYATQKRTPKLSAAWFTKYVTSMRQLPVDGKPFPPCDSAELIDAMRQGH